MAKTLDFNAIKKRYLTVKLADEKNTTLLVGTPTKAIMSDLMTIQAGLDTLGDDADADAMDDLYRACARVMSRNKAGIEITPEYLEEIFDFEDVMTFFAAYMDFMNELASAKN